MSDTDEKEELYTVCLFLAQAGDPHLELGFATQNDAFKDLGDLFGVPPNTVKNIRDAYDNHTDSSRVGWKRDLPDYLAGVHERLADTERQEFLGICRNIIKSRKDRSLFTPGEQQQFDIFERVAGETDAPTNVRRPVDGITIPFSNTGRRSDGWFLLTLDQVLTAIQDLADNNDSIAAETGNPAEYNEAQWRRIFETYLTDEFAKTMGKVQTLPLFELLSKIIHFSSSSEKRETKKLSLDKIELEAAGSAVAEWQKRSRETNSTPPVTATISFLTGGENIIFYGAPGTGKSHKVDSLINGSKTIRTVFHPDLQNSDFFGSLKPMMEKESVGYGFAPGPFMEALAQAHRSPSERVCLVIEELNRAAAAAVFGDLFLLLDRDEKGASEYDVSFPSPESRDWFKTNTGLEPNSLRLPSNLWILATMNSADQGVFPIDTAFRRRWRQEYLPLDYKNGAVGQVSFMDASTGEKTLDWRDFVRSLNEYLSSDASLHLSEDRLLGQWFVKPVELTGSGIPQKVLLYLWDDLLRHEGRERIFDTSKARTFGELASNVAKNRRILSDGFLAVLNEAALPAPEEPEANANDET